VMLTFDDGYRDNYEKAFPILKRHGLKATFFVPTAFIDKRELSWWDTIAWMIRHSDATELPAGKWFPRPLPMTGEHRERAIYEALQKYKALPGRETANYMADIADATGHSSLPGTADTRLARLARRLRLRDDILAARVSHLSTGERQRLALLRAIVRRPRFLLLDEPTSALDHDTTLAVEAVLREVMAEGVGLLVVSHNAEQAVRLQHAHWRLCPSGLEPLHP